MSKIPNKRTVEGIFKCPRCKKNTSIINFDRWQKQIINGKSKLLMAKKKGFFIEKDMKVDIMEDLMMKDG